MKRLAIILAGLALVTAACGGDKGSGTAARSSASPDSTDDRGRTVLARMDGLEITAADVYISTKTDLGEERAQSTMQNPDMLQVATAGLLDQFLWAAEAERQGFKLTPEEEFQVRELEARFLATRYVGDVIQYMGDPTPEQVKEWYDSHQEYYLAPARVGVRHILVDEEATARRLLAEAEGGADFNALVRQYTRDDLTRDINGALGFVESDKEILGLGKSPNFENAVLPLKEGEMTVVQTHRGWHVVRVDRRQGGGLLPIEEVTPQIVEGFRRRNWPTVYNEQLQKVREQFNGRMVDTGFEDFTGVIRNVDRLLDLATQHPDAPGRIELYRRVAVDFRDHEKAPYAQFMIAYLYLTDLNDSYSARKAINRLRTQFGDSDWRKAGDYLEQYTDPDAPLATGTHQHEMEEAEKVAPDLPSPEEILKLATKK